MFPSITSLSMKSGPIDTSRGPKPTIFPSGLSAATLLLIAILFGVLYYLTPYQLDDWMFMGAYRNHNGGSDSFSLSSWIAACAEIRANDNGRLSNILSPVSTLWSPWKELFPWLTGLAVGAIVWSVSRIGFGRRVEWSGVGVTWLLIALFLPWRDALLVRDFALNYVWAAAVTFVALWLLLTVRGWNLRFFLSIPVIVAAGWWHEGFVVPTLCGLGVVALIRRFRMSPQWWTLVVLYAVAGALMTLSPGMLNRASKEIGGHSNPLGLRYLVDIFPLALLVASTVMAMLFRKGRARLLALVRGEDLSSEGSQTRTTIPFFPLFFTVSVAGAIISLLANYTPRVCFWSSLCALTALLILYRPLWRALPKLWRGVVGALCVCLCVLHLLFAISWQSRYHREAEQVLAELERSETGTVFIDVIPKRALSPLTLYYPSRLMWLTPFNLLSMGYAQGDRNLAVVPADLATLPPLPVADSVPAPSLTPVPALLVDDRAEVQDGRAPQPFALYRYCGHLVARPPKTLFPPEGEPLYLNAPSRADVTLAGGTVARDVLTPLFFFSSTRGDTLLYIATPDVDADRIESLIISPNL